MQPQLPPGPRVPKLVQTIGWWTRTPTYFERLRRRYGTRFTLRLLGLPPAVFLSDPADARELFRALPDVLHPGEGGGLTASPHLSRQPSALPLDLRGSGARWSG